jgi:hypothetical protein
MTDLQEKHIRLTYLWKKIILLAFSPSGSSEINNWISIYSQSIVKFWEVPNIPKLIQNNIEVFNTAIPIDFNFTYDSLSKFNVKFYHLNESREYSWMHDVDKKYYIPEQPILSQDIHMKKALKKLKFEEVEEVLDGMFFHPTAHQHISEDEERHSIRIGGGIHNAFQFLFHLRYQLCLIEENRVAEKQRLITLFYDAIKGGKKEIISPSVILDL